jgi:hypothetical protein
MTSNKPFLTLCFSILAAGSTTAFAQPDISWMYEFHKVSFPGSLESFPLGINNSRDMAGTYIDANGVSHGFTLIGGRYATVDYPGTNMAPGLGSFVGSINDHRDVTGIYYDAQGYQHGFIRIMPENCDGGGGADNNGDGCKPVFKSIDVPGALNTQINFELGPGLGTNAIGLNNHRDVVGLYASTTLTSSGFLLSNGMFRKIDDPLAGNFAGDGTKLFGVNDYGDIAGDYITQTSAADPCPITHGFFYDGHTFRPIFVAGSDMGCFGTQLNGLNNRSEVVGTYTDAAGSLHGLYWAGGMSFRLDYPGMPFSEVHEINDRGDVTGAFADGQTEILYGFVAFKK